VGRSEVEIRAREFDVMRSTGKVIPLVSGEDRLRDELMTARAILRNAIDGPVDKNLLELISDLAEDLKKAVRNYRSSGRAA
jgi:hypothetical protein